MNSANSIRTRANEKRGGKCNSVEIVHSSAVHMSSLDFLKVLLNMRYSLVEDDVTVPNARGLREVAHERESTIEYPVPGQIRLRSGSAAALNAQRGARAPLNRRRPLQQREKRSTQRRPRLN